MKKIELNRGLFALVDEEAALAYNQIAIKYHGKYAGLNHIPSRGRKIM